MFNSRTVAALAAVAALLQASVALGSADPCTPLPDHSNYSGDHGLDPNGAWCPWDSYNFYKPQGVGCKTDAECQVGDQQRCVYGDTNGRDEPSIIADVIVNNGIGYCDYNTNPAVGGTECACGVPPLPPHPGRPNNHPSPTAPGQDPEAVCRDLTSKRGYPDVNIVAGCWVPVPGDRALQCMFQCNSANHGCPEGADPKAIRKIFTTVDDCPGYTSVPFS